MPRRKKLSKAEFAKRFARIAEESLAKVPPAEQDRRIADFENAVVKIVRGSPSKVSGTSRTPVIPLHTRGRE